MKLSEKLERIVPKQKQVTMDESKQLELADEIEKTLESIGVQIQPRFEIPLSSRVASIQD
jgi:hypothetical protein